MSDIQELESEARANASSIRLIRRVLEMCKARELILATAWGTDDDRAIRSAVNVLCRQGYMRYSTRAHRYMLTDKGRQFTSAGRRHRRTLDEILGGK